MLPEGAEQVGHVTGEPDGEKDEREALAGLRRDAEPELVERSVVSERVR